MFRLCSRALSTAVGAARVPVAAVRLLRPVPFPMAKSMSLFVQPPQPELIGLRVVPMLVPMLEEGRVQWKAPSVSEEEEVQMDLVVRKRRLKMKKHKLRKRRKEQRAKRQKLKL